MLRVGSDFPPPLSISDYVPESPPIEIFLATVLDIG